MENAQISELPKITARHLERAEQICALRLHYEFKDVKGSYQANMGFRVSNRLLEDARLAHTDLDVPKISNFPTPAEYSEEEQALYQAVANAYFTLFGDRPARVLEPDDPFTTELPESGIRLVGSAGLLLETANGKELRILRIGGPDIALPLSQSSSVRFSLLRHRLAASDQPVLVTMANLIKADIQEELVVPAASNLENWLNERVQIVKQRAESGKPEPGIQCRNCPFIPRCPALK